MFEPLYAFRSCTACEIQQTVCNCSVKLIILNITCQVVGFRTRGEMAAMPAYARPVKCEQFFTRLHKFHWSKSPGALSIKLCVALAMCLWLESLLFSHRILNHKHLASTTLSSILRAPVEHAKRYCLPFFNLC